MIEFIKQSLIDYSIKVNGKHIGWIQKIYTNGKNSGNYYFGIRIVHPDYNFDWFLWDMKDKLSEAKNTVKEFLKGKI